MRSQRLSSQSVGGFNRFVVRYPPHYKMHEHKDHRSRISLVVAGSVIENSRQESFTGEATSVVIKGADISHSNLFGPTGARMISIEWPSGVESESASSFDPNELRWIHGGDIKKAIIALADPSAWLTDNRTEIENRFTELLAEISIDDNQTEPRKIPSWMPRALDQLRAIHARQYSIKEIASEVSVHPVHFSRMFKSVVGCTASEFVRRLRVQNMAHQLATNSRPLSRIAIDAGFVDGSHATRCFQREIGMLPSVYRRRFREAR